MDTPLVAVAGGGPAASIAAIELAREGFRVSVFEQAHRATWKPGDSLPPTANALLERLGIMSSRFRAEHLPSYGLRSAWGVPTVVNRDFLREPHGPGWHLDRTRFERALAIAAMNAGADWKYGVTLRHPRRVRNGWAFSLVDRGGTHPGSADFLIDATGRRRTIARALGIGRIHDDRLIAAVRVFRHTSGASDGNSILVESVPYGWWYSAPLPDGSLMVVLFTDSHQPECRNTFLPGGHHELLRSAPLTFDRVGGREHQSTCAPGIFDSGSSRLAEFSGDGWLGAGDAAAAFDPLSSHGLVSALGSGYYAARATTDAFGGNTEALAAYSYAIQRNYSIYLAMLLETYWSEQRWRGSDFWRSRHKLRTKIMAS